MDLAAGARHHCRCCRDAGGGRLGSAGHDGRSVQGRRPPRRQRTRRWAPGRGLPVFTYVPTAATVPLPTLEDYRERGNGTTGRRTCTAASATAAAVVAGLPAAAVGVAGGPPPAIYCASAPAPKATLPAVTARAVSRSGGWRGAPRQPQVPCPARRFGRRRLAGPPNQQRWWRWRWRWQRRRQWLRRLRQQQQPSPSHPCPLAAAASAPLAAPPPPARLPLLPPPPPPPLPFPNPPSERSGRG